MGHAHRAVGRVTERPTFCDVGHSGIIVSSFVRFEAVSDRWDRILGAVPASGGAM